eukprot:gnl/MRDRNA2_/MRDRNA2_92515_c0_seq1.p1 gnl/MRDRNA2_/MRDRNA2_92515_c0~~gnl/MRDRNA2_/MRDRNA2_92515_c0_seq1.p1  ORF type:complete len:109 (+),score=16.74 gnl/MRDRNA2_/MRDRNA2_92515_c0_seq1:74-400(+)
MSCTQPKLSVVGRDLHDSQSLRVRQLHQNFAHELIIASDMTQEPISKGSMKKIPDEHQRSQEASPLKDGAESAVSLFLLRTLGMWPSYLSAEKQLIHLCRAFEDDFKF